MNGVTNDKKILFFLLLVMNVQTATFAMTVDDVFYDQHFSLDGQSLSLNGVGLRKIFFVKVYAAGLYLPQTTQSTSFVQEQKGPKRMRLVLRRDVDAADFVEALKDGLQDNSSERQRKSLEKEISTLVTVMEKIGDV